MSPRYTTEADKAKWAAYMREYRARRKATGAGARQTLPPTERQLEILRAYADPSLGGTQQATADALGISISAVHNQLGRLMQRLGVRDPAQAVYKLWVEPYLDDNASLSGLTSLGEDQLVVPNRRDRRPVRAVERPKPALRVLRASPSRP